MEYVHFCQTVTIMKASIQKDLNMVLDNISLKTKIMMDSMKMI